MKSKAGLYAMMALAAIASGQYNTSPNEPLFLSPEEEKRKRDQKQKRLLEDKGVKEFTIDGVTVFARNLKNAQRKVANKKMWEFVRN